MRKLNLTEMANRTLKVVVPKIEPPYINQLNYTHAYEKMTGMGPGIVWQLLRDMADHLNLKFEVESVPVEGWGQIQPNGTWTGAFGKLHSGQAEILAGGSMMTPDRNQAFDFSTPIGYQSSGILIRVPKRRNFVSRMLISAFDVKIWLTIFACFIISMFVFHYIQSKLAKWGAERHFGFSDEAMIFFSIFAKQQINCPPRSIASRTLIATLWLSSIFLMATFGASLISLFAHGTSKLPFETLEDLVKLVKDGEWKLVLDMKSTGRIEMIELFTSDTDFSKIMNDPERVIFVTGLQNGINTVQHYSGNAAFIAPSGRLNIMSQIECNVTMLPNHVLATYLAIAFRKGSPYRHYLNRRVLDFWQNGLLRRWMQKYSAGRYAYPNRRNVTKCQENWDDRLRRGIFGLVHFENIFILLGVGLVIAFLAFLREIFKKRE